MHYHSKTIIYEELDEANEVTFIHRGSIELGYEINKRKKFILRRERVLLGCFELMNDIRFQFVIRAGRQCSGYFIRKKNWAKLEDIFPQGYEHIQQRCASDYLRFMKTPIEKKRNEDISYFRKRKDYTQIVVLQDL